MRILLTGAAGSVGYETLRKLVGTDNIITALDIPTRKNKRRLRAFRSQARIIYGSVNDASLMEELVQSADVVIHLAAVIPPLADRKPELAEQVNIGGTETIVEAIKKCNPQSFLVFSSSVSVYGDRLKNHWIKVGDPLAPSEGDFYAATKIKAEEAIRASGIRHTIFRFSAIMGRPATDPLMFHMPLETQLEIASVRDTAEALVTAVTKLEELDGHTYNLGGGPRCRISYREFLKRMFHIYGLKADFLHERAFAKRNFHCGWYQDSDELEEILHFQHDDLESYFASVQKEIPWIVRFFTRLFSRPIIYFLTRKSEPLLAKKENDTKLVRRFYGNGKVSSGC